MYVAIQKSLACLVLLFYPPCECMLLCISNSCSLPYTFFPFLMSRKGKGKRLSKGQRMNIIEKLSKPNPLPKQLLAHEHDISGKQYAKLEIIGVKLNNDAH